MAALIPLLFFILTYRAMLRVQELRDLRIAFLMAATLWGSAVVLVTEFTGIFGVTNYGWLLFLWGVLLLAALVWVIVTSRNDQIRAAFRFRFVELERNQKIVVIGLALLVSVSGLIGLLTPPNNWDAMTYHMARVANWIQNESVNHYRTNIEWQLYLVPWAEFAIMNLQILFGGDRLANMVQWFSMLGSVIGVSLIAKLMGAGRKGQLLSAVVAATIPMGVLQSMTTMNDYVVSFWLVCFVSFIFLQRNSSSAWFHPVGTGLSLGLAVLTKSTTVLYAAPFVIWLFGEELRQGRWRSLLVVGLIALTINFGHFWRNTTTFGNPIYAERTLYVNETVSVSALVSNVLRNLGLHVGTGYLPVNKVMEDGVVAIVKLLGSSINDPRTTSTVEEWEFRILAPAASEARVGNFLHLMLISIAILVSFRTRSKKGTATDRHYVGSMLLSFILFVLVLKWTPWHSRLHLPWFVLWAPLIGVMFERKFSSIFQFITSIALLLIGFFLFPLNETKPMLNPENIYNLDRTSQYFIMRPELERPYAGAIEQIRRRNCRSIGLLIGRRDWEYPIWILAREQLSDFEIVHVGVENVSNTIENEAERVCAVFSTLQSRSEFISADGITFTRVWESEETSVYTREIK